MTTRRSLRGLDWLNFFMANLQTGFGPFIAVYLTTNKWTQGQIGVALSVGSAVAMLGQVPGGALIDALPRKRVAAAAALVCVAASAGLLALWPAELPVYVAESMHGFATCMLVPAVAAITLGLVGRAAVAERLGRNARYGAVGNAVGAALMGACGTWLSTRSVFWLAAALTVPALLALRSMSASMALPVPPPPASTAPRRRGWKVLVNRKLLIFASCAVLFHLSNAAMLPLAAGEVTKTAGDNANLVIAACIVMPQFVVAAVSPWIGRAAERLGRRPILLLGFAALPVRGLLLSALAGPAGIIGAQMLDGVGAAVFGVMMPLISADLSRRSGRFNTAMGVIGLAAGLGATFSTTFAGEIAVTWDTRIAFLALAAAGLAAVLAVAVAMPETRPSQPVSHRFKRANIRQIPALRWRRRLIRSVVGRKQKISQPTLRR